MDSSKTKHRNASCRVVTAPMILGSHHSDRLTEGKTCYTGCFPVPYGKAHGGNKTTAGTDKQNIWDSSCVLGAVLGAKKAAECCAVSFPYWNSFLKFRLIKTHLVFANGCRKHRRPVTRAAASPTNLQYLWKKPGTTVLVMEHWR